MFILDADRRVASTEGSDISYLYGTLLGAEIGGPEMSREALATIDAHRHDAKSLALGKPLHRAGRKPHCAAKLARKPAAGLRQTCFNARAEAWNAGGASHP
jgi:hypothetical protein